MDTAKTKPAPNQLYWKRAFLVSLPLAALAILATAICPKPIVTIAPYNHTMVEGAAIDDQRQPTPQPADLQPAAPTRPLPDHLYLPPEKAPLAQGDPDHNGDRQKLRDRLKDRRKRLPDRKLLRRH